MRPLTDPLAAGVSVVIPCFNSQDSLEPLVDELAAVLTRQATSYELILVNDGSVDDTWATICRLSDRHGWIRGVDMMRNYGQHNATLCGARLARYDVTVTLDDDLQNPPSEIPRLLSKLAEGYDVVYGTPVKSSHSLARKLTSWVIHCALTFTTREHTVRVISPFRAYRTALRAAFVDYRSPHVLFDALLGWGTTRIVAVPVLHDTRRIGRSNYSLLQLWSVVFLLWTGYSTAPLRLASWLGFAFVLFGAGILVYVIGVYVSQGSLPGFPFLASTIAVFGGVQLFTLGIIGEYLARVFNNSLTRPTYVIKTERQQARVDPR